MHRFRVVAPLLATLVAAASCKSDPGPSTPAKPARVTFATGFLWGTATAGFQVESGLAATDWAAWVKTKDKIKNGDSPDAAGPDALAHVDEDIALMKAMGNTAYRFSIEWGRLYPTRDAFATDTPDPAAIQAYDGVLAKLKAAGMVPMVTLHHFVTPSWLSDPSKGSEPQAWERPEMTDLFVEYARRIAKRWGDKVDWWCTINEPLNVALGGYVQGSFPPGQLLALDRTFAVVKAEARAHAKAFEAIHAADKADADGDGKAAMVSMAFHQREFHPLDPEDEADVAATRRTRYVWNQWILNVVVRGDWDDDYDGNYTGPADRKGDPALAAHVDWVGVNYYSDTLISASRGVVIPVIRAAVIQDNLPTTRPKTEFGWDIYPEGMGTVLDEVATYKLPILITENGLADAKDTNRARFLAEHLYEVGRAITRGADIRGYFHWALLDNFEWASGFCPKFGFASYDPATKKRTLRPSGNTYRQIATSGAVELRNIEALPPYTSATSRCH